MASPKRLSLSNPSVLMPKTMALPATKSSWESQKPPTSTVQPAVKGARIEEENDVPAAVLGERELSAGAERSGEIGSLGADL